MDRLIFIDCTMRAESRTRKIAIPLVEELGKRYDIETIRLDGAGFPAVGSKILHDRDNGIVPEEYAEMSRRIAAADRLVIAAPFWDMSFPSALKVFFENMSLFHITFDSDNTHCYGLCKCQKVLYITTRGMNIHTGDPGDSLHQGSQRSLGIRGTACDIGGKHGLQLTGGDRQENLCRHRRRDGTLQDFLTSACQFCVSACVTASETAKEATSRQNHLLRDRHTG